MNRDLIDRAELPTVRVEIPKRLDDETCRIISGLVQAFQTVIKSAPSVDAVEVVRCKDCKHRGIVTECPMCYTEDSYDEDYGYDYWDVDKTVDEGFCHCGEVDAEVQDG